MDMSDKPVTNPHPFFIVHRFNVRYSSNFIWTNSLVAVYGLPTQTPLCSANRHKNLFGEFSNQRPMSSSFFSVKTWFVFNGFLSIKMPWVWKLVWKLYFRMDMLCHKI
jgi:hypothetical protein